MRVLTPTYRPLITRHRSRIGEPVTDDGARGYWILALKSVLGATESREFVGDRLARSRKQGVEQ